MQFNYGQSYLDDTEKSRLETAKLHRKLYENGQDYLRQIYSEPLQRLKEDHDKWLQIAILMPRLISKVSADFLFLEPPVIEANNDQGDKFIEEIYNGDFKKRLYMAAVQQSIYGGVVLKMTVNEGKVGYDFLPQYQYTPNYFIFTNTLSDEVLTYEEPAQEKDKNYLLVETYEKESLESRLYRIDAKSKAIDAELSIEDMLGRKPIEKTIKERSPLFYIPLLQESLKDYGLSDYDGLESLFYALNRRLTHNEHSLEAHGGAKLAAPTELFDEFGRPIKSNFEYWAVPSSTFGGEKPFIPQYVQQQLSVEQNIETIKEYLKFIFLCTEISPDVFGLGDQGVESGKALKMRLLRTLIMVRRKASIWQQALKGFLETAAAVSGIKTTVSVQFQDGLPTDWDELIDQEIRKVSAGIQSKQDAIKVVDESDDEAALKKLEQISAEQDRYNQSVNAGLMI